MYRACLSRAKARPTQYISLLYLIVHMEFQTAFKSLSAARPQNPQNTSPNPTGPNIPTTTPPLDPTRWWTLLIEGCMRGAGVPDAGQSTGIISLCLPFLFSRFQVGRDSCSAHKADQVSSSLTHNRCDRRVDLKKVLPTLAPALIKRFESREGYRVFDDVEGCCKSLSPRLLVSLSCYRFFMIFGRGMRLYFAR
jgi:hypothetical protein